MDDRAGVPAGGSAVVDVLANDRGADGTGLRVLSSSAGVRAALAPDRKLRVDVRRDVTARQAAVVYALTRDGRDVDVATLTLTVTLAPPPVTPSPTRTPRTTASTTSGSTATPTADPTAGGAPASSGPTPSAAATPTPGTETPSTDPPSTGTPGTGTPSSQSPDRPAATPTASSVESEPGGAPDPGPDEVSVTTGPASAADLAVVLGTTASLVPELTTTTRVPELALVRAPLTVRTAGGGPVTVDVRSEQDLAAGTTVEAVDPPANGRTAIADDLVVYDPDDGFAGDDAFAVTMTDGSRVEVAVTVLPAAPLPVALDDTGVTVGGRPVTLSVLANDRFVDTVLSLSAPSRPAHATVQVAGRTFEVTPEAGFRGPVRFDYVVRTPGGASVGTVEVTVLPRVTAAEDHVVVTPGAAVEVDVLANDPGGRGLHVRVPVRPPAGPGTVDVVGDRVQYRAPPVPPALREVVVRYDVSADAAGTQVLASSVVRFQVEQLGAPLAVDDELVLEHRPDGVYELDVLRNDRMTPDALLSIQGESETCPQGRSCKVSKQEPDAGDPDGDAGDEDAVVRLETDLRGGETASFSYWLEPAFSISLRAAPGVPATVTVRILGPDTDTVAAQDDRAEVLRGGSVTVDVLANDLRPSWYVAEPVTPLPAGATFSRGVLTYRPPVRPPGPPQVQLTYRLVVPSPGIAAAALQVGPNPTATVVVDVREPVAHDDVVRHDVVPDGDVVRYDVLANDEAPPGAEAVLRGTSSAAVEQGRVLRVPVTGIGSTTYEYDLVLRTSDAFGNTVEEVLDSAVVTVEVRRATAVDDAYTVVPGETVDLPVLRNDRGTADRVVRVPSEQDVGGTLTQRGNVLVYTMDDDLDRGTVSFEYLVGVQRLSTDFFEDDRATVTITRAEPPGPPQQVVARGRERAADVSWAAPATDGGLPVTGYRVRWQVRGAQDGEVRDLPPTARSTTITGLLDATPYDVSVTALNRAGESEPGRTVVVPPTRPSAPRDLVATGGTSLVVLAWQPPSSDGGRPLTGYRVTWSARTSGAASPPPASTGSQLLPPTATSTVVPGLADVLHDFSVVAENELGAGPAAQVVAAPQARGTQPDRAFTTAGAAVTIAVLANDGDVSGLALSVLPPASGTAQVVGDGVRWVPAGPFGEVTLTYVLGVAGIEVVRGTAVVHEVDAVDDRAVSPRGRRVPVDVLANDLVPSGVDGRVVSSPDGGLVLGPGGSFTPTTPVVRGQVTATYELVADGRVVDAATLTVDVGAAPRAVDDVAETSAGVAVRIPVLANDVDGAGLRVVVVDEPDAEVGADGVVTYRPPLSASGVVSFRYELRDDVEAFSAATVRVTVRAPDTRTVTPSPEPPDGGDTDEPDREVTGIPDEDTGEPSVEPSVEPSQTPVVTDSPTPTASPSVEPDVPTLRPGGLVRLSGGGCRPGERVPIEVDGRPAVVTRADDTGRFEVEVPAPTDVGRHELVGTCSGREFRTTVDLVVTVNRSSGATGAAGGATVVAGLLSFYLLIGSVLVPRGTAVEVPDEGAAD